MPELPEVETIARQLRARGIEGRKIQAVTVHWPRMVAPLSVNSFVKQLRGKTIEQISRVGKWMLFSLGSGKTIMIHLRMSGSFSLVPGPYDRMILKLSDDVMLYYSDPRKFGRWQLVDDPDIVLGSLGPDALTDGFTFEGFRKALRSRRRKLKPLLLDQSVVAGLGNIYADEALWEAKIHPERRSDSLTDAELAQLYRAIPLILWRGVKNGGTSLGVGKANYRDLEGIAGANREEVLVYGRAGQMCPCCKEILVKIVVGQRGTTYCPRCQPEA